MPFPHETIQIRPTVAQALAAGRPVVALETTVLTHGIPAPTNLELGRAMEAEVRAAGAEPATIGVLAGRLIVGLEDAEIEILCREPEARKLNARDLAPAAALGWSGGTTVSATMALAHAAGIRILATGGVGGVHRGPAGDVSGDLTELGRTPMAVVCSGAKAILDLPRTLEWLETLGVPVVGWRTDRFPEFFSDGQDLPVSARVDTAQQAAHISRLHLGTGRGLLICVPCPTEAAVPQEIVEAAANDAEREALAAGVGGKDLTPFLLRRVVELTGGATLRANRALLLNNARVAAEIASALGA